MSEIAETNVHVKVVGTRQKNVLVLCGALACATVLGGYGMSSWAATTPAHLPSSVVAGVRYVVPPFVGGSKVRTPDAIDSALLDDLATSLSIQVETTPVMPDHGARLLKQGKATIVLATAAKGQQAEPGMVSIPVGYPMKARAIMRTDTDIKRWEQLAGRTVCLSEGGLYVGEMAKRYGAIEQVYKAPADSLLALRTGGCDAAVHDDIMLAELLRLPEWKKFSASLTTKGERQLRFLVPSSQPELQKALKRTVGQWKQEKRVASLNKNRVRDIAFEVYLDQEVTDCH